MPASDVDVASLSEVAVMRTLPPLVMDEPEPTVAFTSPLLVTSA